MKPSIPKGTRDFSPLEMMRRNYIFDTIRSIYLRYGFQQIETPAMELTETLLGKYGEEGDRLIFTIFPRGEKFKKFLELVEKGISLKFYPNDQNEKITDIPIKEASHQLLELNFASRLSKETEEALRYDLTVPFARYVVMHQNEITFPFKRFQIQPVWRADRPQKGRYREFYQCDADIIGSNSLLNEVELIQIIDDVFSKLGIGVVIKINNRKILSGLAEATGAKEKVIDLTVAIDKLEKIGLEKVKKELVDKGFQNSSIAWLDELANGKNQLSVLENYLLSSEIGKKGIEEINNLKNQLSLSGKNSVEFDPTLARGLNYYTGTIIEVKVNDPRSQFTSSICGGGRYDDLTGIFGLPNVSGVGISFGADRIYDVMEEINGFPDFSNVSTKILFVNFGEEEAKHCMKLVKRLRDDGVNTELYPDAAKMKKQMSYADAKKIPYVALIGTEEIKTGDITIKNMSTGEQSKVTVYELLNILK